jgi:hypothetical protein
MSPEMMDASDIGCVRCGRPFERKSYDADLIAQLMGTESEGAGRAICENCIKSDELLALAQAELVDPDS